MGIGLSRFKTTTTTTTPPDLKTVPILTCTFTAVTSLQYINIQSWQQGYKHFDYSEITAFLFRSLKPSLERQLIVALSCKDADSVFQTFLPYFCSLPHYCNCSPGHGSFLLPRRANNTSGLQNNDLDVFLNVLK